MTIRPATPGDAGAIAAIYAPYVSGAVVSFEAEAPDAATIAGRMAGDLYPWLVLDEGEGVAGYAYAGAFSPREAYRWAVETTIYVAGGAHGRGIGRRLYGALLATLTAQGFTQAMGRIALPNPGSLALHEALGFREAGVMRGVGWKGERWVDVAYWQRPLATGDAPADPLPFAAVGVREG